MSAVGELIKLPVLSPIRLPMRNSILSHHHGHGTLKSWQHRHYRLPPLHRGNNVSYGPDGYTTIKCTNGRVIDLYV